MARVTPSEAELRPRDFTRELGRDSSFAWAELVSCPRGQPTGEQTSRLARRVASELSAAGWRLVEVTTDGLKSTHPWTQSLQFGRIPLGCRS